jgi:DNA replication and repair protein RecF
MSIAELQINQLRNIHSTTLQFHPRTNFIHGLNGSGKTSLLEAIYLLSSGHSFRTREAAPLISHNQAAMTVFARTNSGETVSIQKSSAVASGTQIKLNQQPCLRTSDLAHFLPCQVFYQDIFEIIDAGPATRRMLLDWGLFHVKQSYLPLWKDYRRVCRHRNALLRQKASWSDCVPWNKLLVELSAELDKLRAGYMRDWSQAFQSTLAQLTDIPCSMTYFKGWDKRETGKSLAILLEESFHHDQQRQYTQLGAHQADVVLQSEAHSARKWLSRGQQKIILIALKLAQASLLSKPCLFLLDDVTTELDTVHLARLAGCLEGVRGQFFLTGLDESLVRLMPEFAKGTIIEAKQGQFCSHTPLS